MWLRKLRSLTLVLLMVFTVVACSASSRVVRTYDGEARDAAQVATLVKAADMEITQIDGQSQKSYLLDNSAMQYELLPGTHEVVFRYSKLWALPGNKDIGEKRAEEIESDLMTVTFTAEAGGRYRFELPQPDSREEAEQLAREPEARLLNENDRLIAEAAPWQAPAEIVAASNPAAASASSEVGGTLGAQAAPGLETGSALPPLEAMKILWGRASAEEKKEFLRWAFQ